MLHKILSRFLKNNKETTESVTPVIYSSFEDATAACNNDAYQNEQLVKVVVEKNRLLRETLAESPIIDSSAFRTLVALCNLNSDEKINVLDLGAGVGTITALRIRSWAGIKRSLGTLLRLPPWSERRNY